VAEVIICSACGKKSEGELGETCSEECEQYMIDVFYE